MISSRTRFALLVSACALAGACSSSTGNSGFASGDDGGVHQFGGDDGGEAGNFGDDGGGNQNGCSKQASGYIYVVDVTGKMYQFDPPALKFMQVGDVTCASNQFFSMGVDRDAVAWVLAQDGTLVTYNIVTHDCQKTSFAPNQNGFLTFGMGFSSNSPGSTDETLFVSDSELTKPSTGGLAKIDTKSLTLTPIGTYSGGLAGKRAEMTGTGDARLFGAFEGTPYVVAEVDKSSANIKSQAPQTPINYPPDSSNFAFAFWGGDFWLFVGPGTKTDVFQYKASSDKSTTLRDTQQFEIVGAGVSTCAPTVPPK